MALRFRRIQSDEEWGEMVLNEKALNKGYAKRKGRIMFPTSHDITPETVDNCILVLKKLLRVGNKVLITTKPSFECIHKLIHELREFKPQIQFRFTITSRKDKTLEYWEPHAPRFMERFQALIIAFYSRYETSISIEPFLDKNPIPLIQILDPYVSKTIWLGKLNYQKTEFNTWENIKKILKEMNKLAPQLKAKIRIKDSIQKLINKEIKQ